MTVLMDQIVRPNGTGEGLWHYVVDSGINLSMIVGRN